MKNFFEEKKRSLKFKKAGPGHKLNESTPSNATSLAEPPVEKRVDTKDCQEKRSAALAAALQRSAGALNKPSTSKKFSSSSIKPEATNSESRDEGSNQSDDKPRTFHDIVAIGKADEVAGVFFRCPEIGGEAVHTKKEWQEIIQQHLEDLKKQDSVLAATLAIKTLNVSDEADQCIGILLRYLRNLIEFPENEKYRSIRMSNPKFVECVLNVEGALDFLLAVGFNKEMIDGDVPETRLVYKPESQKDLESLSKTLIDINGFTLVLDRDFKMLQTSDGAANHPIIVPDDFFELSISDVKKEQRRRTMQLEKDSMLMSKKMREMEKLRNAKKKALYTRIRIRLPNNLVIQGTFSVDEKVGNLRQFIDEKFNVQGEYSFMAPPSFVLDENKTFSDLDLEPAVQLVLKTNQSILINLKEND